LQNSFKKSRKKSRVWGGQKKLEGRPVRGGVDRGEKKKVTRALGRKKRIAGREHKRLVKIKGKKRREKQEELQSEDFESLRGDVYFRKKDDDDGEKRLPSPG